MPPKVVKSPAAAVSFPASQADDSGADESEDASSSRALSPVGEFDFTEHRNLALYFTDPGTLEKVDNGRQSEVWTGLAFGPDGGKHVVQSWEPYAKPVYEFIKSVFIISILFFQF